MLLAILISSFGTILCLAGAVSHFAYAYARTLRRALLTLALVCAVVPAAAQETEPAPERKPLIAVSTNLLFEGASALAQFHTVPANIGLELPLGRHWSLYTDYLITVPWAAWNNNADCAELMHLHLGTRWYPSGKKALAGWYLYGSVGAGYYDFERDGKGYQGEDLIGALGGGYSIAFGEHLRLNLAVGFGALYTPYRYYQGRNNNQYLTFQYSGTWWYFGPTDAKITLTWLFYRKAR